MSETRIEILQSACDTCNLYIQLQRTAHRGTSRVSDTATGKLLQLTDYYFELAQRNPLPATLTTEDLLRIRDDIEQTDGTPAPPDLHPLYTKLEGWFLIALPDFIPSSVDQHRTDNEHNKRMLRSNRDLRSTYRVRGEELMDAGRLSVDGFREKKNELTHACTELRLWLEADRITVDNAQNADFEAFISTIRQATHGGDFLEATANVLAFINGLTAFRIV